MPVLSQALLANRTDVLSNQAHGLVLIFYWLQVKDMMVIIRLTQQLVRQLHLALHRVLDLTPPTLAGPIGTANNNR